MDCGAMYSKHERSVRTYVSLLLLLSNLWLHPIHGVLNKFTVRNSTAQNTLPFIDVTIDPMTSRSKSAQSPVYRAR